MSKVLAITYGVVSYVLFLASFVYAIGFVGDLVVPRSVDHAIKAPIGVALVVNLVLLLLFAVQHSVMARPAFKRWWTRFVPQPVERSTYVLLSSLILGLLYWQWREMPAVIWDITWQPGRLVVWALFWLGWATALSATFMINHFELFGLQQVFVAWRGRPAGETAFRATLLYKVVRHPLMLGFLVAFWAAPTMTVGHLLFAAATTGYILVAIQLEERDLIAALGARYTEYRQRVPMVIPGLRPRRAQPDATTSLT